MVPVAEHARLTADRQPLSDGSLGSAEFDLGVPVLAAPNHGYATLFGRLRQTLYASGLAMPFSNALSTASFHSALSKTACTGFPALCEPSPELAEHRPVYWQRPLSSPVSSRL